MDGCNAHSTWNDGFVAMVLRNRRRLLTSLGIAAYIFFATLLGDGYIETDPDEAFIPEMGVIYELVPSPKFDK
jgi:hypothetical protein